MNRQDKAESRGARFRIAGRAEGGERSRCCTRHRRALPTRQGGDVSRVRERERRKLENLFQNEADPARTNKRRKRQRARARYSLQGSVQELRTGYIEGLLGALAAR